MSPLMSKDKIKALKEKRRFFASGISCKYNHEDKKYISNGNCYWCTRQNKLKYRASEKGKKKEKEYQAKYIWKGKEKARLNSYGLTDADYKNILIKQNNKCAICEMDLDLGKRTCIDHDHKTNKVRGILCWTFNVGLGHFKDNVNFLKNAIRYCEYHLSINT